MSTLNIIKPFFNVQLIWKTVEPKVSSELYISSGIMFVHVVWLVGNLRQRDLFVMLHHSRYGRISRTYSLCFHMFGLPKK